MGVLVLTWGLVAASLAVMAVVRDWHLFAKLICIGQGLFLPIMGLFFILLPSTHEFDLRTGLYRRRSAINPQVRPLTDIVGVQAIRGPVVEATPEEMATSQQSYQLNLVVVGGSRRVVVTCMVDDNWVAEAGGAVSDLLGVPLIGTLAVHPADASVSSSI